MRLGIENTRIIDPRGEGSIEWRTLAVIFAVALLFRVVNAIWMVDDPSLPLLEDGDHYWRGAQAWIDRGPFMHLVGSGEYEPQTERVPGYHIFLIPFRWIFGDMVFPALAGQAVIGALTCVVIAVIGSFLGRSVGILSGYLAAIWPNFIIFSGMILGDTLFVFLFSVMLFFSARFVRNLNLPDLAFAGLFCGLAILTRPVLMFMPIALALALPVVVYYQKFSLRRLFIYLAVLVPVTVLPVSPQIYRNVVEYNTYDLTSQGGTHLLYWVVGEVMAHLENRSLNEVKLELHKNVEEALRQEGLDAETLNPFEYSDFLKKIAGEQLVDLPVSGIALVWLRGSVLGFSVPAVLSDPRIRSLNTASFYGSDAVGFVAQITDFLRGSSPAYLGWFLIGGIFAFAGILLQLSGLYLLVRISPWAAILAALVIAYFLILNGPVSLPKYRLPYEPVLIILQALALLKMISFVKATKIGFRIAKSNDDAHSIS